MTDETNPANENDEMKAEVEETELSDEEVELIPFHAINDFMRSDFRLRVLRQTFQALPRLDPDYRQPVDQIVRQRVTVPGFRNSTKAPAPVRATHSVKTFEDDPELVGAVLGAWAEAHPELRQRVYDLLAEREWDLLPIEADRRKLPGFMIEWPSGEDFETLDAIYHERYPEDDFSDDEISLMIVWLSDRLPYKK